MHLVIIFDVFFELKLFVAMYLVCWVIFRYTDAVACNMHVFTLHQRFFFSLQCLINKLDLRHPELHGPFEEIHKRKWEDNFRSYK